MSSITRAFMTAICEAMGYPLDDVQRIVIDVNVSDGWPHVYVQFAGGERLLNINWPGHLQEGNIEVEEIKKPE